MSGAEQGIEAGESKIASANMGETPFGDYTLFGKIDHGAMSEVYLAAKKDAPKDLLQLERLHVHLSADPRYVSLFFGRADIGERIRDDRVARVYEHFKVDNRHCLASELLSGVTLGQLQRKLFGARLKPPPEAAVRIALELLEGASAGHAMKGITGERLGLVHRDLNPENVFLSWDGDVKILGFGEVGEEDQQVQDGLTGVVRGYAHRAPEIAAGAAHDARADVWSVGVLMWEMLAGRRLFDAHSGIAVMNQVLEKPVESLGPLAKEVPAAVHAVVAKALERELDARWGSAAEMADALRAAAPPEEDARDELGHLLQRLFDVERRAERKVLAHLRGEAYTDPPPPPPGRKGVPSVAPPRPGGGAPSWLPMAVVGGILVLGAAAWFAFGR